MRVITLIFLYTSTCTIFSQNLEIKDIYFSKLFEFSYETKEIRKALKSPKTLIGKINPFYYISSGLIFTYQNIISEQIQADCMYEVSCSQYAKLNVQKYGLVKGTLLGFHQLNNCIPSAIYDYPDFKINKDEKIINFK